VNLTKARKRRRGAQESVKWRKRLLKGKK